MFEGAGLGEDGRSMLTDPTGKMKTTVIVCTYNRYESLAKALGSVASSTLPESVEWEVLVVDNNSRDRTRDVVEDFCRRYPGRFRYLFEPRQGKSYALNTAISEARGDVLVFMDDDVIVESTWLQNLTIGVCSGEWAGAGGRIIPQWPCAPPPWLPDKEWYGMAPLVMFDLGLEAGPLTDPPFGTNMAFHRRMFEKYGTFRTDLGPRPNSEIRSEDTEFGTRLLAAGERIKYEPAAVVYHSVPQKRLQREYFLAWWIDKGRADMRENRVPADTKWLISGIPLYLFRRLTVGTLRWMLTFNPSRRFSHRLAVWWATGMMVESHQRAREVEHEREKITCG
jgi:glycosyltransferase involved in cell wall biosynthesis